MNLFEAIQRRRTTNTAFADRPIDPEHKRQIFELAARAPSHFNSQPWRFVVVEDAARRRELGEIAGESMRQLISEGRFWRQYARYFRFSEAEVQQARDGIYFDHLPPVFRPFLRHLFTDKGGQLMNTLQVPRVLANDARRLVESSPLLVGIALTRSEYRSDDLSGLYSVISLGAVLQTIWLSCVSLGMGLQFVSAPQEIPEQWARVSRILAIPDDYELMLMLRLGYVDEGIKRPTIDWTSPQRKGYEELVFQERWGES